MTIVALVEARQAPLLARRFYERGDPGAIATSLAHVPELLDAAMPFIGAVLGPTSLPPRLKEIIVLRTSSLLECRYCIESHTVVALDAGLSRDEVLALRRQFPLDGHFTNAREHALLDWVDQVAGGLGAIEEDAARELESRFCDAEVVEITLVAATTMMLNRYCSALSLPSSRSTIARLTQEGLRWAP